MSKTADNSQRVYYSIGEVAGMFKVNTSLIRFWEKEFDVIRPHRTKKGNRMFTNRDVDYFHMIFNLVKERGYTLQGAKDKIRQNPDAVMRDFEIIKTLESMKSFLLSIKKQLD